LIRFKVTNLNRPPKFNKFYVNQFIIFKIIISYFFSYHCFSHDTINNINKIEFYTQSLISNIIESNFIPIINNSVTKYSWNKLNVWINKTNKWHGFVPAYSRAVLPWTDSFDRSSFHVWKVSSYWTCVKIFIRDNFKQY
jgi:hypothetical protein